MKFQNKQQTRQSGFSLTELLIALVIVGILVAMALPKFTSVINKTKTTEAKLMLDQVYMLEEAYRDEHDFYTKTLSEIGYRQDKLVTEGGKARYKVEVIEVSDTSFIGQATAVVDIYKNGKTDVWTINQRKELIQH